MKNLRRFVSGMLATIAAVGCRPAKHPEATQSAQPKRDPAERLAELMNYEAGIFEIHDVELFDGAVQGKFEASKPPRPECSDATEGQMCTFELDLGHDPDGDPQSIGCMVTTVPIPFGVQVHGAVGESSLTETPLLASETVGEGTSMWFTANTERSDDSGVYVGTTKVGGLFAPGYFVSCFQTRSGMRKTFERIVKAGFSTMRFKQNETMPTLYAATYLEREGDRVAGARHYEIESRSGDEAGFVEVSVSFGLQTDGKTWKTFDALIAVHRDPKGEVESYRRMIWLDGNGPIELIAKPAEDGRYRLKSVIGSSSNSLELTPKAPLNTEIWAAPEFRRVAAGSDKSYRYAQPYLGDDRDPSLVYIELTRRDGSVLEEREVKHDDVGKAKATDTKDTPPDELHINGDGVVSKEVSTSSVSELVRSWGALPEVLAARPKRSKR